MMMMMMMMMWTSTGLRKVLRENTTTSATDSLGYYEFKQALTVLKIIRPKHQAILQWLQNQSQTNRESLNNVRRETNRTSW
jgi:hypothetical protein